MTDETQITICKTIQCVSLLLIFAKNKNVLPLLWFRLIEKTIAFVVSAHACVPFSCYAMTLAQFLNDNKDAHRVCFAEHGCLRRSFQPLPLLCNLTQSSPTLPHILVMRRSLPKVRTRTQSIIRSCNFKCSMQKTQFDFLHRHSEVASHLLGVMIVCVFESQLR
jgi:hypothetical protein